MDEGKQLYNRACKGASGSRARGGEAVRLGEVAAALLKEQIAPLHARFGPLAEAWEQLLPAGLRDHCRLADVSGGQLKVIVDSPSYANELRWCEADLVSELQQNCPRARIKKITFTVGSRE